MRIGRISVLALSLALASGAAYADDKDKDHKGDHGDGHGHGDGTGGGHGHGDGDDHKGDGGNNGIGGGIGGGRFHDNDDDDTADDDSDGGASADPQRTPAQADFRQKLVDKEHALVKELANHPGRKVSMAERQNIGVHYRHIMRLLRIRELAERAKDDATVKRVDALLDREDKKFRGKMNDTKMADGDGGAK